MLQQRNLTRSFISNLSSSKDPTVTHCCTFLSSSSLCRGAASQPGRSNSSCAFCMNVLWRLTVPCVHICPGVPFICSTPSPGARNQDRTNQPTSPQQWCQTPSQTVSSFSLSISQIRDHRLGCWCLSHDLPRAKLAYERRCRLQGGQKKVIYDPGATSWYMVHEPCPELEWKDSGMLGCVCAS